MNTRRLASFATVGLLTAVLTGSSAPASGGTLRTETSLGGYSIKTNAAPFKVLLDDPASAIPHETGSAILEADPSYTQATLETGPTSRGMASSLWPGALLGDGIGTASGNQIEGYPIKADARYPDKPYTATANGCFQGQCGGDGGAFMQAQALGLDVSARARMNPGDVPGQFEVGTAWSTSTANVKNGVAIGTSESRVTDVSLLAGMIRIGSVSTTLTVNSNGKKGTSSGSTVVTGLMVGTVGYVVDDKGARPVGAPTNPGTGPLPTNAGDPAQAAGITISGISQEHRGDASTSVRDAKGLRISVDTVLLRGILNQVPSPVTEALATVFSQAPKEMQGYLFYLLTTTPKITFILGAGTGVSAASLPLSFDFPDLPIGVSFPPPPVSIGGPVVMTPPMTGSGSIVSPGGPTGPGPQVLPTSPRTVKAAAKDPFGGLSPGLLLLVLALSGVGGWGLVRLQSAALLGATAAGPCTEARTSTLPDLRGA